MNGIIDIVISWIGILIAAIAAYATIRMLIIMKNEMYPKIDRMSNNIGFNMERAKKELIYKKHFPISDIDEEAFNKAVVEAYNDIMLLMPDLDKKGRQDEDWYLGEWLCNERPYYSIIKGKDKKDVAYHIYTIRKVKF